MKPSCPQKRIETKVHLGTAVRFTCTQLNRGSVVRNRIYPFHARPLRVPDNDNDACRRSLISLGDTRMFKILPWPGRMNVVQGAAGKGEGKVTNELKSCRSPRMQGREGGITEPVVSCAIFARNLVRPIRGEGPTVKRYFAVDVDEPDRNAAHHFKTSTGPRVALSSGSEHWVTALQAMYPYAISGL